MRSELQFEWKPDENLRRIVCAANRLTDSCTEAEIVMLIAPRHWDDTMRNQYNQMNCNHPQSLFEQGFIDNFGKWHNRKDALIIARRKNQVVRELDYDTNELYSEMLY